MDRCARGLVGTAPGLTPFPPPDRQYSWPHCYPEGAKFPYPRSSCESRARTTTRSITLGEVAEHTAVHRTSLHIADAAAVTEWCARNAIKPNLAGCLFRRNRYPFWEKVTAKTLRSGTISASLASETALVAADEISPRGLRFLLSSMPCHVPRRLANRTECRAPVRIALRRCRQRCREELNCIPSA